MNIMPVAILEGNYKIKFFPLRTTGVSPRLMYTASGIALYSSPDSNMLTERPDFWSYFNSIFS